ncbi:MAG TPA: hypothetical protein VII35_04805, partial [Steroidobacteraceae bacterium]
NGKVKDASTVLGELGDKFQGMADGPNKVAFAIALLGKQGQSMIPVLNQGSAGLQAFKDQAEAAGIVVSGDLAASAEQFEQKAAVLKATLVDGLGIQIATQLLPVLTELMEQFKAAGGAGSALGTIAGVIVGGIKLLAAGIIETVSEFEQLGKSMGAVAAAAVAIAHGNFAEAATIWKESTADNEAIAKSSQDRITGIFEAGGADQLSAVSTSRTRIEAEGANLARALIANAADVKLEQFSKSLAGQVSAFGLGGAALVEYRLHLGDLAKEYGEADAKGKAFAASAIANAKALEVKKDDKTVEDYTAKIAEQIITLNMGTLAGESYKLTQGSIGLAMTGLKDKGEEARQTILALTKVQIEAKNVNAIQALDDQAQKLSGHLVEAAKHAFDLQNKTLKTDLEDTGNAAGLAKLDTEREHIINVAKINELNLQAAQINSDLAAAESKINLARTQGQISDLTAQAQESDARTNALTQLNAIYASEQQIAAGANDPALVDGVKKFGVAIDTLKAQTSALENQVRTGLESSFANNFSNLIQGATSFKNALLGFLKDIDKQFADMIAKQYTQQLFAPPSGSSSGGMFGGLAGLLAGLAGAGGAGGGNMGVTNAVIPGVVQNSGMGGGIGNIVGAFAGGGTIPTGKFAVVGEQGPELAYSGAKDMTIIPQNRSMGDQVAVHNYFTVQAPGGVISRQSQMQTAAAAARALGQANRRNNT